MSPFIDESNHFIQNAMNSGSDFIYLPYVLRSSQYEQKLTRGTEICPCPRPPVIRFCWKMQPFQ